MDWQESIYEIPKHSKFLLNLNKYNFYSFSMVLHSLLKCYVNISNYIWQEIAWVKHQKELF